MPGPERDSRSGAGEELVPYVAEGELVAEDAWKLGYYRHFVKYEEGFPTLDDLLSYAYGMSENETGAPDYMVRPDGSRVEGEELDAMRYAWEDAHR